MPYVYNIELVRLFLIIGCTGWDFFIINIGWLTYPRQSLNFKKFSAGLLKIDCHFLVKLVHQVYFQIQVYEHAHKLHHYLHGTLSFDAHIFGNGMPEEFCFLLLELLAGSWYVLKSHRKCGGIFILIQRQGSHSLFCQPKNL